MVAVKANGMFYLCPRKTLTLRAYGCVSALDAVENDLGAAPIPNPTPFRPSFADSYVDGDAAPNSTQDAEG